MNRPNHIQAAIARYGYAEISSGTLRAQDLLPAYLDALEAIAPAAYQQVAMPGCGFTPWPSDALHDASHEWWQTEAATNLLDSLAECLEENAPDGYHFGTSDGDGASIGFWPNSDE